MKTSTLKENEAQVTEIHGEMVTLEWSGDWSIHDFDLGKLGKVIASGHDWNSSRTGWAIIDGPCLLKTSNAIPRTETEPS